MNLITDSKTEGMWVPIAWSFTWPAPKWCSAFNYATIFFQVLSNQSVCEIQNGKTCQISPSATATWWRPPNGSALGTALKVTCTKSKLASNDVISKHPGQSTVLFLLLIDMYTGDKTCIFYTLEFICNLASKHNISPVEAIDHPSFGKLL